MPDNWRSDEWKIFVAIGLPILLMGLVGYFVYLLGRRSRKTVIALVSVATLTVVAITVQGINRGDLRGLFGLLIYLLALALTAPVWLTSRADTHRPTRRQRDSIETEATSRQAPGNDRRE